MDTKLKPITAIFPRTLLTSQHSVLHTPYDTIAQAVDKLRRDQRAWVRPEDVDAVIEGVGVQENERRLDT